jgi:predicted nucleic acid-binding protein
MTHFPDTSAVLAHHLAEPGAQRVQELFDQDANVLGICVLTLLEFEVRLHALGMSEADRRDEAAKYKSLFDEIVPVTEAVCEEAVRLKFASIPRLPSIDALIAAAGKLRGATLVHRDLHFLNIPAVLLSQEMLPSV